MKTCGICGNAVIDYRTLYDDRFGYPGRFRLARCSVCNHKSLQADFTPETISRLYTDYYPRSTFDVDRYQPYEETGGFNAWFNGDYGSAYRWVPRNVRVLDVGCGFGETLGYHENRGCDAYGVEADENIRRVADRYGFNVHVGLFDADCYEPDFFDYVTLDQVIEHVDNPVETLRSISRVLKPGGVLVLSTPNSNGWGERCFGGRWVHWHAPYHLHLFSEESMRLAASKTGLDIERAKTVTSSDWIFLQWTHLLTRPGMGTPSVFWNPRLKRNRAERLIINSIAFVHLLKIDHVMTRLFDALGMGDNYLFILRKRRMTSHGAGSRVEGGKRIRGFSKETAGGKPSVSIITAVYNGNACIEEAIKSAISQDYTDMEYLLVDGGSTDGTVDTIRKYDDHIDYWLSEPDKGVYDAFNKGIDLARGEWLYFLGADDKLFDETVLRRMFSGPAAGDFLYGNVVWGNTGKVYGGKFSKLKLTYRNICQQAIFYRRELFKKVGKFDLGYPFLADWAFNMQCFANRDVRPVFIDRIVAIYCIEGLSLRKTDHPFEKDREALIKHLFGLRYLLYFKGYQAYEWSRSTAHDFIKKITSKKHR